MRRARTSHKGQDPAQLKVDRMAHFCAELQRNTTSFHGFASRTYAPSAAPLLAPSFEGSAFCEGLLRGQSFSVFSLHCCPQSISINDVAIKNHILPDRSTRLLQM